MMEKRLFVIGMKAKHNYFSIVVVALFIALSSCRSPNSPVSPTARTTDEKTETVVLAPTVTQGINKPTLEFTSISTLNMDAAYNRVIQLLNGSPSCRLPCWFDINPGGTPLQEADSQLQSFQRISRQFGLDFFTGGLIEKGSFADLSISYPQDNMVVEISPSYMVLTGESNVSIISIHTRSYRLQNGEYQGDVYDYRTYNELLKAYTIPGILAQYGQPEKIFILASLRSDTWPVTPGYGDSFEVHLWYPEKGFFLIYKMTVVRFGDNYRFCPSKSLISGYFLEPSLRTNYQDILISLRNDYRDFFKPSIFVKNPKDAFDMSVEKFFQMFLLPTDQCLETPISIWWPN